MAEPTNILEWALYHEQHHPNVRHFTQPLGGGVDNIKTWTFAEAVGEARRMATYLGSLNFPEKSRIAICSKNCAHWIIADWAIWMAGHVTVPIYPTLTAETVGHILRHSGARLLFVGKLDPVWEEMKTGVPGDVAKVAFPLAPANDHKKWDDIIEQSEPLSEVATRSGEEMATIIYTSGSTGVPKGVMVSFNAMMVPTVGLAKDVLKTSKDDRMLSYLPLAHGMERWLGGCLSTYSGFQIFFAESIDTFVQDLQRSRPTLFVSVPRLWQKFQLGVFKKMPPHKLARLLKIPILRGVVKKKILTQLGLDQVRYAASGSAPIPKELIEWYRSLGLELLEGYGMTENFNYSHCTRPGQVRAGYVGTPYDDVECRIGEGDEVLVKSPGMMMGYYKMPEETQEVITEDGFLHTGDRGRLDEIGRLQLIGRVKEIFKTSKGKYVSPAPIESKLLNHPLVEMCCVSGSGQPQPYALIVLSEDARAKAKAGQQAEFAAQLDAHRQAVNRGIEDYEALQLLAVVDDDWLPENGMLTPTMKIRRNKIEESYAEFVAGWYAENKPVLWHTRSA